MARIATLPRRAHRAALRAATSAQERLQASAVVWKAIRAGRAATSTVALQPPAAVQVTQTLPGVNPQQTLFLHWSSAESKTSLMANSEPIVGGAVLTQAATEALRARYRAEGRRDRAGPGLYVSRGLDTSEYGPELLVVKLSTAEGTPVRQTRSSSLDMRVFDLNAETTGVSEAPWVADYANGAYWSVITKPPTGEEAAPVTLLNPTTELANQFWAEQRLKLNPSQMVSLLTNALQATRRDIAESSRAFVTRILDEHGYDYLLQTPLERLDDNAAAQLPLLLEAYRGRLRNTPRAMDFEARFPRP